MATLTIRNVPDAVRDALRVQAAKNGRSMEAELRAMLAGHVAGGGMRKAGGVYEAEAAGTVDPKDLEKRAFEDRIRALQKHYRSSLKDGEDPVAELIAERRANPL